MCRPVHCQIFTNIPGLYPLEASGLYSWVMAPRVSPDIAKHPLGRRAELPHENHLFNILQSSLTYVYCVMHTILELYQVHRCI